VIAYSIWEFTVYCTFVKIICIFSLFTLSRSWLALIHIGRMSSLAEAFQEDASRQEKFRESLLREKATERAHRKQV
jgi:hypothetical protein